MIAAILFIVMRPNVAATSGFVLVVKGAPPAVFINNVARGGGGSNGALCVGARSGQVNVQYREGFTDYLTTITGSKGETQT